MNFYGKIWVISNISCNLKAKFSLRFSLKFSLRFLFLEKQVFFEIDSKKCHVIFIKLGIR